MVLHYDYIATNLLIHRSLNGIKDLKKSNRSERGYKVKKTTILLTIIISIFIFSSISFLEATINEIICDIVECEDRVKFISDEDKEIIRNAWLKTGNDSLDRRSVLKKYQFILKTLHAEILDNSTFPL